VRAAVTRAGPGIITGGLTTAGAFLTLTVNEFKGFEQLGVITAFGMTLSFFAALTVGAKMLCAPSLRWLQVPPKAPRARRGVIGRFVERRPFLIIGAGLVITALMVWRGTAIPWSYNYLELLPANSPAVAAMETLAKRTDYSGEVAAIEVDSMEKARAVTAALRKKPSVGRIESVATYIPSAQQEKLAKINLLRPVFKQLEAATSQPASRAAPASAPDRELDLEALRANLRELADNLEDARFSAKSAGRDVAARLLKGPLDALHRLLKTIDKTPAADARRRLGRFEAQIVGGLKLGLKLLKRGVFSGPLTPQALLDRLPSGLRDRLHTADGHFAIYIYPSQWLWAEGFLRRFVSELREVDPDVTGFPVTHWEANLTIERGFRTASLLASLALLVLLFVDFRSVRYTVLAVVPLALGVGWMWGGISLMSMSYNFANIVGFPLIIGIGVASGVHILHRFRQEGERNVASVVQHTGQAILLSALTSMAGFGSLALASHRGAASLGVVLLMGVGFCLLTATLALPALLQCLGRRGGAAPPADGGETP